MNPKKSSQHNLRTSSLPRPRASRVGVVRIIAGMWRKTPLTVTDLDGLRPTGDRIRETLFNWLTHFKGDFGTLTGLDFFAGTGALGFEFASRGAGHVTLIEKNRLAARALSETKNKLKAEQVTVINADALEAASRLMEKFDIIFIDPPFALNFHEKALKIAVNHLKANGLIYVESPKEWDATAILEALHLTELRQASAGAVTYRLLKAKEEEE